MGAVRYDTIEEADAEAVADLSTLPLPSVPNANVESLKGVWVNPTMPGSAVCVDYQPGVTITYEPSPAWASTYEQQRNRFEKMASEDAASTRGQAMVVWIGDAPGFLIPTDAAVLANGESQHNAGLLIVVKDGWTADINARLPTADLASIGASVLGVVVMP